jgi:type VI secretion system secreted protein VgrG
MPHTQEGHLISLTTPLGTDKLLLAGFSGSEAISRLFCFHLDLLSEEPAPINYMQIVGKSVTIAVVLADDAQRYFNGIVRQFGMTGLDGDITHYEMVMVPTVWKLTRRSDCRIFHNKEPKAIIEQVFTDAGFSDYNFSLTGKYPTLEYCVQYRETDFNFVSRLMEKYGIFYYFEHEDGTHTMKIADSSSAFTPCANQESAGYNLATGGLDADDLVNSWSLGQEFKNGLMTHTDYNFKTPSVSLLATESTIVQLGESAGLEVFDYPGEYTVKGDGTSLAKLRMQEEEATYLTAHGSSVCRGFTTGTKFKLKDHPTASMNASYVLTEIQHIASVAGSYGVGGTSQDSYSNHFSCIPDTVTFRPERLSPKPFVQGPQTAVVIGKSQDTDDSDEDGSGDGEEIWVDKYGRVIVRFPWDRAGKCSCRVRVSQDWAGQGWGMINIPRVGQEVIVSFLEGDPDRPIITGRVYNAEQTVPYPLPDNQTRSTFKTRSSKGGGTDNYNELRFEDKKGDEQIFLRGEKDFDTRLKNDVREWVGNNRSLIVAKDQMEKAGGDLHSQVTGNVNEKVGQNLSLQVGQNLYEKSGMNFAHEAGQIIHLKAGATLVLEAGAELTLKVGGNFIDINPAGVTIVGTMVMINSGGAAGSGCGSSPTSPKDPDQADDGSKGGKMN